MWNTAFGYLSLAALYALLSRRLHYLCILAVSTVASITNAFLCHKLFVFRTKGNYLREYARYYLVYAIPATLGFVGFPFCIEVVGLDFYTTQALLTAVTVVISYFGHRNVSFRA